MIRPLKAEWLAQATVEQSQSNLLSKAVVIYSYLLVVIIGLFLPRYNFFLAGLRRNCLPIWESGDEVAVNTTSASIDVVRSFLPDYHIFRYDDIIFHLVDLICLYVNYSFRGHLKAHVYYLLSQQAFQFWYFYFSLDIRYNICLLRQITPQSSITRFCSHLETTKLISRL